jgi:hypothetical protein
MPTYFRLPNGDSIAWIPKCAGTTLARAIISAHYPAIAADLAEHRTVETARLQRLVPKTESPDGTVHMIVREPISRLQTAITMHGFTVAEVMSYLADTARPSWATAPLATNAHYARQSEWIIPGRTLLYRFDRDLDALANETGLVLPLPRLNVQTSPKVSITDSDLAAISAYYAADSSLYASITSAGMST